jgi:5-formyltetrahydrofolate cyclo-ligase
MDSKSANNRTKEQWRSYFRALKKSDFETRSASIAVCEKILDSQFFPNAKTFYSYSAARGEVDLNPVHEVIWSADKKLCLPKVRESALHFLKVKREDELVKGAFGILEPQDDENQSEDDLEVPEVLFLPGVGFSRSGVRLGRGKGHYDRFCAGLSQKTTLVAVTFADRVVDDLPEEPHDIKAHLIITEIEIIICSPAALPSGNQ